jgi:tetratricopeptide (TPR) repeat protein
MLVAVVATVALAGCDQVSARKKIQEAGQLYADQEFEKAAEKLEAALKIAPDIDIAHHNLGITYSRLFKAGQETAANKAIAEKATRHLKLWLEKHPNDDKVRKLLTKLWLDSGDYQTALDYWQKIHEADPKARDVIQLIAGIYMKTGDWRTSLTWWEKDLAAAPDAAGRMSSHQSIIRITFNKMLAGGTKVLGAERVELGDIGLHSVDESIKIDAKAIEPWSMGAGLWRQRSLAQGASWAMAIDEAEGQIFSQRARVLKEEAKKAAPPATGTPATGTPATGAPASPGKGT